MSLDTDLIRARCEMATPGPWKIWGMQVLADPVGNSNLDDGLAIAETHDPHRGLRTWNADFIAHARQDVPALLAALSEERLRSALLRQQVAELVEAAEAAYDEPGERLPSHDDTADTQREGESEVSPLASAFHETEQETRCVDCDRGYDKNGDPCWTCGGKGWIVVIEPPVVSVRRDDLVRLLFAAMNDTEPSLQPTLTRVAAIIRDAE